MKKIYILLLFLFFHSYFCQSQPPDGDDGNRVEVIKMAYITHELNLTPQEAQNFWPVYNNYVNEIKQARNQYPNDEVAFEKRAVEIKERYQENFKKILGNKQRANKVYTTDKQFNTALNNELKNRQQKRLQNNNPNQQLQQKQLQQQPHINGNNGKNLKKGNGGNNKKPHPPF
ncbi:MAG: hypothetical protein JO072_08985 [Parafilimonas sp.]|nr:hypothetical protein [Parafilimonas sp.]